MDDDFKQQRKSKSRMRFRFAAGEKAPCKKMVLFLFFAFFGLTQLHGATIVWDELLLQQDDELLRYYYYNDDLDNMHGWTLVAEVDTSDGNLTMSMLFATKFSPTELIIKHTDIDVGYGKFVSHVEMGDAINATTVRSPEKLFETNWPYNGEKHDFAVGYDEIFLLGFEIFDELPNNQDPYISVYGWAMFQFSNGELSLVSSAVAIDADGIYAGTGNVIPRSIPEPSATALLLFGFAILATRRPLRHSRMPDRR